MLPYKIIATTNGKRYDVLKAKDDSGRTTDFSHATTVRSKLGHPPC